MKLFYYPGACSLASHITLHECGVDFTLVSTDLIDKRLENGDNYLDINPKGQVPALLLDDNTLLTEGVVIMQYVADSNADKELMAPIGSIARYKILESLNYIATELHKGFAPLFRPETPEEYKSVIRAALEKKLIGVNNTLANSEWFCGASFTIADAYLFTVLRWVPAVKLNIKELKHISAWMERVSARPAAQAALTAENLV